jgi:predicted transcriptional regulator
MYLLWYLQHGQFELDMLSSLQHNILIHISKNDGSATYNSLVSAIKRDRITISQSIMPLVDFNFVGIKRENDKYEKSRYYFELTRLGRMYVEMNLDTEIARRRL